MLKRSIATRYATALFNLAKEKGILEAIEKDYPAVAELIEKDENLQAFLGHPAIGDGEKKKLLADLFQGKINESLSDLLNLTVDKGREEYIPLIWEDFRKLLMEHRSQTKAVIYTPFALSEELRKGLMDQLSRTTGKTVLIEEVVDRELIGGVRVQIGDRIYDGSVLNQLDQLRESMLSAKV